MSRLCLFLCGFAWVLGACESADERQRSDARAFLGLNGAVDYRSSEGEREKRVADLTEIVHDQTLVIENLNSLPRVSKDVEERLRA